MPQYAQPWKHRILRSAIDAIRHYPDFPIGSRTWDERVYHPDANGVVRPLSELWPDGSAPAIMRWGIGLVMLMGIGPVSSGLRTWRGASRISCASRAGRTGRLKRRAARWFSGDQSTLSVTALPNRLLPRVISKSMPRSDAANVTSNSTSAPPRVAYIPDSFLEVNGVAHTSRHFEAFARRRNLPFLCVRAGDREQSLTEDGNVWTLELPQRLSLLRSREGPSLRSRFLSATYRRLKTCWRASSPTSST